MRAQAIAIFLTVVVALIGVSYYQVGAGVSSDAKALGEAAARSQIAALIPAFLSEFKIINEQYDMIAPRVLGQPVDFTDAVSNRFEMVARLQLGANGVWSIQQRAFHDKTRVKSWAENYTQIALKSLKPRDIPLGGTALTALLDPQRRPFFLWIMRGNSGNDWTAVITKTDVFQAIIDRQRGQNLSVFLVNKQGQALGHTTADYVGTTLKDDPIVAEITRVGKAQGVGTFRTPGGLEVQGLYEQVPGSNSYVVLSRPLTALNDRVASLRLQILLFGGGFAFLGVAVMMLALKGGAAARVGGGGPVIPGLSTGAGALPPVAPAASAGAGAAAGGAAPADLAREKMKAYTTSASALAREMHGPLTRILSQAQLLKAKAVTHEEVTRIEELAREGRNVVLKLLSFAGEEEFRAEPTSVNEVLNRALGMFESRFQTKGIKVEKNLKRMPEVVAHPLALMKILEALLNNAVEAMERMPKKELTVSLEAEGPEVVLRLKDSGEGLAPDKAAQVFDPFFTTKSPSQHSGLGLSTAFGLAREFGGELQFASTPGQGATVTLKFPIGASAAAGMSAAGAGAGEGPGTGMGSGIAAGAGAGLGAPATGLGAPATGLGAGVPAGPGRGLPNLDELPPASAKPLSPPSFAAPPPAGGPAAPGATPPLFGSGPGAGQTPPLFGSETFGSSAESPAPGAVPTSPQTPPLFGASSESAAAAPASAAPVPSGLSSLMKSPPSGAPAAPPSGLSELPSLDLNLDPVKPSSAPSAPAASAAPGAPSDFAASAARPSSAFSPPSQSQPQPAAPTAPPPSAPASRPPSSAAAHNAPLSGIGMHLPPNPTATRPASAPQPAAPAAPQPASGPTPPAPSSPPPLRSVPMPAGPGGQPPSPGTAVAQKPPSTAPLPPRTAAAPAGPVTVTPSVPLGVGLELSGELAPEPATNPGSVIQDRALNETFALIDQVENGPLTPADGGGPGTATGAVPSETQSGIAPENTGFGKIDKPTFAGKKPTAKVAGARVAIRKPGERK